MDNINKTLQMIERRINQRIAVEFEEARRDMKIISDFYELQRQGIRATDIFLELSNRVYDGRIFTESSINFIVYRKYRANSLIPSLTTGQISSKGRKE